RIKESSNRDRLTFLLPVGECQKLVQGFRGSVAPATLDGGAEHQVRVLLEGKLVAFAVNLRRRGQENELLFLASSFEDHLCAMDIGFDSADGTLDNQPHAHRCRQM